MMPQQLWKSHSPDSWAVCGEAQTWTQAPGSCLCLPPPANKCCSGGVIICGLSLPQGTFFYASLILEVGAGREPASGGMAEGWPRSPCQCAGLYIRQTELKAIFYCGGLSPQPTTLPDSQWGGGGREKTMLTQGLSECWPPVLGGVLGTRIPRVES